MLTTIYFNVFAFCYLYRLFMFSSRITNSFSACVSMRQDTPKTINILTHIVACLIDTASKRILRMPKTKWKQITLTPAQFCGCDHHSTRHSRASCISEFSWEHFFYQINNITDQKIERYKYKNKISKHHVFIAFCFYLSKQKQSQITSMDSVFAIKYLAKMCILKVWNNSK